ncbi:MAG: hypothetical protein ACLSDQ_00850 [Adlercreutzia equolifaciens]
MGGEDGRGGGSGPRSGGDEGRVRLEKQRGQEKTKTSRREAGDKPASRRSEAKPPERGQLAFSFDDGANEYPEQLATPLGRLRGNIAAIEALVAVEGEGRPPDAAEREALARYVGWGGLADAFDEESGKWAHEKARLRQLLSDGEYGGARSTLTAFYTPQEIARPIWEAIRGMGLSGGRVLEPSCGTGAFFAAMPEALAGCRLVGVELDGLTARIARASIRPRRSSTAASSTQTSTTNRSTSRWETCPSAATRSTIPAIGTRGCSCTIGSSRGRSTW